MINNTVSRIEYLRLRLFQNNIWLEFKFSTRLLSVSLQNAASNKIAFVIHYFVDIVSVCENIERIHTYTIRHEIVLVNIYYLVLRMSFDEKLIRRFSLQHLCRRYGRCIGSLRAWQSHPYFEDWSQIRSTLKLFTIFGFITGMSVFRRAKTSCYSRSVYWCMHIQHLQTSNLPKWEGKYTLMVAPDRESQLHCPLSADGLFSH